jgi:hypothetical protein
MNLIKKYLNKKTIIFTMIAMLLLSSTTLAAGNIVKNPHESKYGKFVLGPEMKIPRYGHHAVLLDDGRVLVVGGGARPEIYDPEKNEFELLDQKKLGNINSAILLKNGNVFCVVATQATAYVKMYLPKENKIIITEGINHGMYNSSITLLQDGRVLIAGGYAGMPFNRYVKEAYIFDPETRKIERTEDMSSGRRQHAGIVLDNGEVLIFGGAREDKKKITEIYNPKTGKFRDGKEFNADFYSYQIIKLANGDYLLVGGFEDKKISSTDKVIYFDRKNNKFKKLTAKLSGQRGAHKTVLLKDGNVFIVGGVNTKGFTHAYLDTAEIYNSQSKKIDLAGKMYYPRSMLAAIVLKDGKVLITGGKQAGKKEKVSSSELFIPKYINKEGHK